MSLSLNSVNNMGAVGYIKTLLGTWRTALLAQDVILAAGIASKQDAEVITTYAASGAIALTDNKAVLDGTDGALAMTLADGTAGQTIVIVCTNATNDCVTTPANLSDGSTLTANAVGENVTLVFNGASWTIVSNTTTLA